MIDGTQYQARRVLQHLEALRAEQPDATDQAVRSEIVALVTYSGKYFGHAKTHELLTDLAEAEFNRAFPLPKERA